MQFIKYFTLFLVVLVQQSSALYEDQTGVNDWHQLNIGIPTTTQALGSKLYVSTESGVLACLKGSDGSIVWRKHIQNPDQQVQSVEVTRNGLYTLSRNGRQVRKWNAANGELVWSMFSFTVNDDYPPTSTSPFSSLIVSNNQVFVFGGGRLAAFATSGAQLWNIDLIGRVAAANSPTFSVIKVDDQGNLLIGGYVSQGNKPFVLSVSSSNGESTPVEYLDSSSIGVPNMIGLQIPSKTGPALAWISKTGKSLEVYHSGTVTSLELVDQVRGSLFATSSMLASNTAIVANEETSTLIEITTERDVLKLEHKQLPGKSPVTTIAQVAGIEETHAITVSKSEKLISFHLPKLGKSFELNNDDFSTAATTRHVFAQMAKDGSGAHVVRAMIVLSDGAVAGVQLSLANSEPVRLRWIREEALASITKAVWVEKPPLVDSETLSAIDDSLALLENGSEMQLMLTRWRDQFETLRHSATTLGSQLHSNALSWSHHVVEWLLAGAQGELGSPGGSSGSYSEAEKSSFGFQKVIVVLTKPGVLFALDSDTGKVLWKSLVRKNSEQVELFVTRQRDFGSHSPEILLLITTKDLSKQSNIEARWINALSGDVVNSESTGASEKELLVGTTLAQLLANDEHMTSAEAIHSHHSSAPFIGIDSDLGVHVFPSQSSGMICTRFMQSSLGHSQSGLVLFRVDKESKHITGYGLTANKDESGTCKLVADVRWSHVFPQSSVVESVASVNWQDPIDTGAEALGDGTVMVKYINPHLVSVAISRTEQSEGGNREAVPAGLVVIIIDAWSGAVIERINHKAGTGPVEMTMVENAIVYSYWNHRIKRTEISSVALFEQTLSKWELNPWTPSSVNSTFDVANPNMLQKTFSINSGVVGMRSTTTRHGISSKNLLIVLRSGQLLALDRRFVNPMRPEVTTPKPTAAQQQLQLMPYFPELPIAPQWLLSYNLTLGLEDVISMPTKLESTTLVFSYGLDLFYTRTAPSKPFDLLAEDFNYVLLVALTTGLSIAVVVMQRMVKRQKLYQQWA